jgi:putative tricarboxylic transport membrane protein
MEDIVSLFHGFAVVLQPYNILLMCIGILLGVIVGVLPGLGGANGVAWARSRRSRPSHR